MLMWEPDRTQGPHIAAPHIVHGANWTLYMQLPPLEATRVMQKCGLRLGGSVKATYLFALRPIRTRNEQLRLRKVFPAGLRCHPDPRRLMHCDPVRQLHRHVGGVFLEVRLGLARLSCTRLALSASGAMHRSVAL